MKTAILWLSGLFVRSGPSFGFSPNFDRSISEFGDSLPLIEVRYLATPLKVSAQLRSWSRKIGARVIFFTALIFGTPVAHSAGEHQYLAEGNLLVLRLTDILVREGICEPAIKCASNEGGHVFVKPVKDGVEISIYGIRRVETSSKLLQESAGSFAMRDIGQHLWVQIFESTKASSLNQKFLNKERPKFYLRVEK
jgi:hypothetical protein